MKIPVFSSLFYTVNVCGLAFGTYLVLAHSLYRIIVLYCLFNILLLWLIESRTDSEEWSFLRMPDSKKVATGLAFVLVMSISVLVIGNFGSIYTHPSFVRPLLAFTLAVVTILALLGIRTTHGSFFTSSSFLLPAMIAISLVVNFSIYLVQPNPFARPLFTTVDAYRDFANAARIVKVSGFRPEDMILQSYYTEFPVIPILISILSLGGAVSIEESQIILVGAFEILGVVGVWLLSTAVVRKVNPAFASSAGVLTVILVWLQPYFIDPDFYFAPLRLSISLLVLVMYMLYSTMVSSKPLSRSFLISIVILVTIIAPMHATAALAVIGFCVLAGLLAPTHRPLGRTMILIALMFFGLYLFSGVGSPFANMLSFVSVTYSVLSQIFSHGPAIISNRATALTVSEPSNFMLALPLALALSICTVCVAKSWLLKGNLQSRKLNLLHLTLGVLALAGLAVGYSSKFFSLDMRYFAYPATGLIVIACAVVLSFALRNANTSILRGLLLISIVIVYGISISPSALYPTGPTGPCYLIPTDCRLIPTQSESAAGDFVSTNMPVASTISYGKGASVQVLSDWPFYNYVRGVAYSRRIGIERNSYVVDLMFVPPTRNPNTFVILRQYYLQSTYLEQISPYTGVLKDVDVYNRPNYIKIYDCSTTEVYLGAFGG